MFTPVYFSEMKGGKRKQTQWRRNRKTAYRGSRIHFNRTLIDSSKTLKEEGFVVDQFLRKDNPEKPSKKEIKEAFEYLKKHEIPINFPEKKLSHQTKTDSARAVLKKAKLAQTIDWVYNTNLEKEHIIKKEAGNYYFVFENNLTVTYIHEVEEQAYLNSFFPSQNREASAQLSKMIPKSGRIQINQEGILNPSTGIIYEGYWSFEKLAHSLPDNYRIVNVNK